MGAQRTYGDEGPIAALASGYGALALIRVSGAGALEILAKVFSRPEKLSVGNTTVHGWITSPNGTVDEVMVSVYRAPRSYSGEDGADISCHGGQAAVKAVLETLRGAGFRDALPGEFTFRAFMNGKIDLTRSESVMELVSTKTGRGLEGALRRLSGALEQEIREIKEQILETLSAVELVLDYPDDEVDTDELDLDEDAGGFPRREAAEKALARLKDLSAGYRRERLYGAGAFAVIAGRPNAGKSSLFNVLLNEDRSIVAEAPGTTRDWIEASVSIEGIPLRLADTAGLREAAAPVEEEGIRRSRELLETADIILYVIDGAAGFHKEDREFLAGFGEVRGTPQLIAVLNKIDAAVSPAGTAFAAVKDRSFPVVPVSAKTGEGIPLLCQTMVQVLSTGIPPEGAAAGLGTERQKILVDTAAGSLREALALAGKSETLDIIAPFLRAAADSLGEITGDVSTADILEAMFSRFCVGK